MVELKKGFKWFLFLSSYSPLMMILAVRYREFTYTLKGYNISIITLLLLLISFVSIGVLFYVIRQIRELEPVILDIEGYETKNKVITEYLLFYILPFIPADYSQLWILLAFIVLFAVIGILHVRSNYLFANPILALAGYDMVEIDKPGRNPVLLTKNLDSITDINVKAVNAGKGIYIEV